ncbi:hypothetical protein LNP17_27895 [Klebsiella variicola subsp. variicola]|nr:hypothetical protein [Klebsiella variicola subsp. variicola]
MRDNAPWLANVRYLYFNPTSANGQTGEKNALPRRQRRGWISTAGPISAALCGMLAVGAKIWPYRRRCGD